MNKKYLIHLFEKHKVILFIQTLACALLYGASSINNMNEILSGNIPGLGRLYIIVSAIFYAFFISVKYYQMRSVDVLDSLPSKKQNRKMSEVLFGWIIFAAPFILCMIIGFVYALYSRSWASSNIFIIKSLAILITGTLYYLVCVFLLSLCTSLKEGIINSVLVLMVMYGFSIASNSFIFGNFMNVQAFSDFLNNKWYTVRMIALELLEPFSYYGYGLAQGSGVKEVYRIVFIIGVLLSTVLLALIYRFAKKRRAEDVGNHKKCLPLYFTGVALGSFFVLMASFHGPVLLSSTLITWAVSFVIASIIAFLYDRNKKVIVWTMLTVLISGICGYGIRYGVIQSEGFGTYRNYKTIPDTMDIEVVLHSYGMSEEQILLTNDYIVKRGELSKKQFYQVVEKLQDDMVDIQKNNLLHFKVGPYDGNDYGITIVYGNSEGLDSKERSEENAYYSYSMKTEKFDEWIEYAESIGCKVVVDKREK